MPFFCVFHPKLERAIRFNVPVYMQRWNLWVSEWVGGINVLLNPGTSPTCFNMKSFKTNSSEGSMPIYLKVCTIKLFS